MRQRSPRVPLAAAFLLMLAAAAPAAAQTTVRAIGNDFRYALGDIWYVWTSPFRADGRDYAGFAAVAGTALAASVIDDDVDRWIVRNPDNVALRALRPLREEDAGGNEILGDLGTGKRLQPIGGVLYVAGLVTRKQGLRDAGLGCVASQLAISQVRHGIYLVSSRDRPLAARDFDQHTFRAGEGGHDQHSFIGGHAANSLACATYLSTRFELGVAEPLLYATALGIGFGRMADRRHWTSDTVVGMAFGYAVGRTVAHRQLRRLERRAQADSAGGASSGAGAVQGGPYMTGGRDAVAVGWRATF